MFFDFRHCTSYLNSDDMLRSLAVVAVFIAQGAAKVASGDPYKLLGVPRTATTAEVGLKG